MKVKVAVQGSPSKLSAWSLGLCGRKAALDWTELNIESLLVHVVVPKPLIVFQYS